MKWSFKIGRWFGIDVFLHVTFVLVLAFVSLAHLMARQSLGAALTGILLFLALFACVLLHEFGHALTARYFGVATRDITLLPIGGLARLERFPEKPLQEFWIAVAGPAVNVGITILLALWLTLTHTFQPLSELSPTRGVLAERLLILNVFLVLFNMLPAFPMDGGRVLRSLLAMRLGFERATLIAAAIGQGMALLFGLIGLFYHPMLLLIALFVWIGASQEAEQVQIKASLSNIPVSQAMLTRFEVLSPQYQLHAVVELVLSGSQQDFPVVDEGHVVGIVERRMLLQCLAKRGLDTRVEQVMRRDFPQTSPSESLQKALERQRAAESPIMPVTQNGHLVGLLTTENIGEYLLIRSAIKQR